MTSPRVVPHHIARVMNGNGRWAFNRFLPRIAGHQQGVDSVRRCVKARAQRGVGLLTVFAFSSENWNRPAEVVCGLMDYGGRGDIVQAAAKPAAQGQPITEPDLSAAPVLTHVPAPDWVIRTGGELRISNFLLWKSTRSKFYFSDKLWPEFDEDARDAAIEAFHQRERCFGKTSAQLQAQTPSPTAA